MPVARYVFYVGGVLLALLFVADALLPGLPAARGERSQSATIRIHSDRKWPERIVLDTSLGTIAPVQIATEVASVDATLVGSPKAGMREAFAQLQPVEAARQQSGQPEKIESKPQRQGKAAKKHPAQRMRLVARPLHYGWFGNQIW